MGIRSGKIEPCIPGMGEWEHGNEIFGICILQNSPLLVDEKVWKIDLCVCVCVCVCVCTCLYERGGEMGEGESVCA